MKYTTGISAISEVNLTLIVVNIMMGNELHEKEGISYLTGTFYGVLYAQSPWGQGMNSLTYGQFQSSLSKIIFISRALSG